MTKGITARGVSSPVARIMHDPVVQDDPLTIAGIELGVVNEHGYRPQGEQEMLNGGLRMPAGRELPLRIRHPFQQRAQLAWATHSGLVQIRPVGGDIFVTAVGDHGGRSNRTSKPLLLRNVIHGITPSAWLPAAS